MKKILNIIMIAALALIMISCATLGMEGGNKAKSLTKTAPEKDKNAGVEFSYNDPDAVSVSVAGDFNQWNTEKNPLTKDGDLWKIRLDLQPGSYMYKFVVNGSDCKTDPANPNTQDDGYGGQNSVINVGSPAKKTAKSGSYVISFSYSSDDSSPDQQVYLAGDMNNWSTTADKMEWDGSAFAITKELKQGEYAYKFVVDGNWLADPASEKTLDDGYGGQNSIVIVGDNDTFAQPQAEPQTESTSFEGDIPVTFTYQPLTGGIKKVFLAGDFNNWSATATPLAEDNGIYTVTLNLKLGKYAYKFVEDGKWLTDENADEFEGDGYGGQNSIVFVGDKKQINALRKVVFSYKPLSPVNDVYLAGSLNDWNQKADMMTDEDGDGVYEVTKLLKNGDYSYKFVVDGMNWLTDESADHFEEDGFGGRNSIIKVDDSYPSVTLAKGDGEFLTYGLPWGQSIQTINPLGANSVEFKLRVHKDDLEEVCLIISGKEIALDILTTDSSFEYYTYTWQMPENISEFNYSICYKDGGNSWYMNGRGYGSEFFEFTYSADRIEPFYTPEWVKDGVIYQIFPERFANGDKANDPDFSEWYYQGLNQPPAPGKLLKKYKPYYHLIEDWYDVSGLTKSPYHAPDQDGYQPEYNSFYGGDIAGIHQNLDYLVDLGVTIIYFNPLFQAKSNHKYDAADYMKIDPHFGTNQEFREFVDDCHKNGIHVIIDCAFNHTGETFWAFTDGAQKCDDSPYYDWYEWHRCPLPKSDNYTPSDYYECWWGFGEMPNLNYDLSRANPEENSIKDISQAEPNQAVVDHIMEVVDFWIKDMDLDGFRLDVPNEVPFWFWKIFRNRVKSHKPDAWLVGEIWSNAVDWVNNDYFDSVMNYAYFKDPVQRFFNMRSCSAKTFDRDLKPGRLNYPTQAAQTMMNLIDSHDTVRYLQAADGDVDALKMAAAFQMTYVGAPHIWYGDEIAMMGKHDPDCRRPFNWKYRQDAKALDLLDYYQNLIKIRKDNPALRRGTFKTLATDGMAYAFIREYKDNTVVVIINNDSQENDLSFPLNADLRSLIDQISGQNFQINNGSLSIKAMPYTAYILK